MPFLFCKTAAVLERGFANLQKSWDAAGKPQEIFGNQTIVLDAAYSGNLQEMTRVYF